MYQSGDFKLENNQLCVKRDNYPLSKINDAKVKQLSLKDNMLQILFWITLTSAAVWFAWSPELPEWYLILAVLLTVLGGAIGIWRSAKYELQIEFQHSDDTGAQWVSVARCRNGSSLGIFEKQVSLIKQQIV